MSGQFKARVAQIADKGLFYTTIFLLFVPLLFSPKDPNFDDFFYEPKFRALTVLSIFASLFLLLRLLTCKEPLKASLLDTGALLFFGLCAIAALFSYNLSRSIYGVPFRREGLITQLGYAATFLSASFSLNTESRRKKFFSFLFLSALLVCAYGIAQYLGLDPVPRDRRRSDVWWKYQSFATLANPHYFADFVLLILPTFAFLVLVNTKLRLIIYSGFFTLSFTALVSSLCRGGYLAAFICAILAFFLSLYLRCLHIKKVILLLLLAALSFGVVEAYGRWRRYYSCLLYTSPSPRD
ncbi:MAG: hypothetical protein N2234_10775, partial [Planctomycetota bacterium]|nr:hypothetical protein [Planctomycetota bacterium]